MKILGTKTLPMTKKHQQEIGVFFQQAACANGSAAMICEARVFAPHLSGVWRSDPQWKVAVVDKELYEKINALLVEANTGKKP